MQNYDTQSTVLRQAYLSQLVRVLLSWRTPVPSSSHSIDVCFDFPLIGVAIAFKRSIDGGIKERKGRLFKGLVVLALEH